jgi:hypothetical protein
MQKRIISKVGKRNMKKPEYGTVIIHNEVAKIPEYKEVENIPEYKFVYKSDYKTSGC